MGPLNCFYYFRLQRGHHDERNLEICHHKRTSSNILCLNAFFIPLLHLTNKVSTMMNCEYYSKILLGIFNKFERGLFSQIFWGWMGVEQLVWFPFNDGHFVVPRWTFFFHKEFFFSLWGVALESRSFLQKIHELSSAESGKCRKFLKVC